MKNISDFKTKEYISIWKKRKKKTNKEYMVEIEYKYGKKSAI